MALLKNGDKLIKVGGRLIKIGVQDETPDIIEENGILTINCKNVEEIPNEKGTTLSI